MRGGFLPIAVLVVVLLAGCAGADGDVASRDDPDGTDSTDATGGDVTLVENQTAVLMAAGSYTSVWEMASDTEGERVSAMTYTHAVDYENERSSFGMLMGDGGEATLDSEIFHADGTTYRRYGTGEEATYVTSEREFAPHDTLFSVESSFASGSDLEAFTAVGTETYDGVSVTRFERSDRPSWVHNQAGDGEYTWNSFDYVVLVDEDGVVRYESWGGDGVDEAGVEHTISFSYAITGVGSTTIEDPEWLDAAREHSEE